MEIRKTTVSIGGKPYRFISDDSDEYIAALETRANDALERAKRLSGSSDDSGGVLAVILLTDRLMRAEQRALQAQNPQNESSKRPDPKANRKNPSKPPENDKRQISVWDLL